MLYYTSAPIPANQVPAEIMKGIQNVHGTYDNYNEKLRACVNTEAQIEIFEDILTEDMLWSLYNYNVTLYSGAMVGKVMGGTGIPTNNAFAAMATKVNGVAYIGIDIDVIWKSLEQGIDKEKIRLGLEINIEHELVHILQIERGDLDFVPEGVKWKGRLYQQDFLEKNVKKALKGPNPELSLLQQQTLLPWELEAYAISTMELDIDKHFKNKHVAKLMHRVRTTYMERI